MSKISYKTYLNDRLKKVDLHGHWTHPLYVQVTHGRKTVFFKSYYFDLFSKPRYSVSVAGVGRGPSLEEIRAKEEEVIDFVVGLHPDDFSLELFKREYAYYSRDLCDSTEEGFVDYLYTFFQDKGMPALARALKEGCGHCIAHEVVGDMGLALGKGVYRELLANAIHYGCPYMPLYGFMRELKAWPMLSLSVMEWEMGPTRAAFTEYLAVNCSPGLAPGIEAGVAGLLDVLRKG
ncbi:hypothetical protein LAG90_09310 [Marinilongibacter aquaticus]|uniref:hypothetical protein n=1 Tax=Marinilongibacter aquaticus TaxID=2975157 RepID=UPI0021BD9842|nr:hypothetical protein [Marinilongibacter aquaticus]UBM60064.1 hypothetical protein LAG90_05325 [Marinilongibacter aquaticus]UBM60833.1 hypothetical protein LAG90_09310 [Marinilongibacter aquaticus]